MTTKSEQLLLESNQSSRSIRAATSVPLLSLLLLAIILGFMNMRLLQAHVWVEHADLVEARMLGAQKLMIDSETGIRGFLLTHNRVFLEPYLVAQSKLPLTFESLKSLIVDPGQKELASSIEAKFLLWRQGSGTIARETDAQKIKEMSLADALNGKRQMDAVRSLVDTFIKREAQIKAERSQNLATILYWLIGLGIGLGLFVACFWIFFARRTYRTMFAHYEQAIRNNRLQGDKLGEERFRTFSEAMPHMAFIADSSGDIIYYNKRWYDYVGMQGTEGWGWKPILHADDLESTTLAWKQALKTGDHYEREYRLRRFDGEFRWHLGRAVAVKDHDGVITEWLGTNTDIHDQKLANEKLKELKENAETANRLKTVFLSNISHEMRTPLGIIIGTTDLVQDHAADPIEVANLASITKRNARHLYGLVNDILDLAKIEGGALLVESRKFPLQSFIDDLMAGLEMKANEKSLRLTIRSDGPIPDTIESDPFRLNQLLSNLIGNAIKFTDSGNVDVTIRSIFPVDGQVRTKVEFFVKDSGIGLTAEQVARLFTPFAQADGSISRKYGGTGIGLVLSREYAKALGGGVQIIEASPNQGCTFRAWITDGYLSQDRFTEIKEQTVELNHPIKLEPTQKSPLGGRRILLVDDSPDNRVMISRFLSAAGANVETAENGQVGVTKALVGDYDVVLMDLSMPVLDGEQATIELRARGFDRPIIALTAHALKDEHERATKVGFSDYLTKPVDRSFLIRRVSEFLNRHT